MCGGWTLKIGHRDGAHPMPNNIITSLADAPRNVPTWLDEVGIFNNILIIIRFYVACGRSNERPYWLDDGRMWGWCEGWCEAGTRRGHYN